MCQIRRTSIWIICLSESPPKFFFLLFNSLDCWLQTNTFLIIMLYHNDEHIPAHQIWLLHYQSDDKKSSMTMQNIFYVLRCLVENETFARKHFRPECSRWKREQEGGGRFSDLLCHLLSQPIIGEFFYLNLNNLNLNLDLNLN